MMRARAAIFLLSCIIPLALGQFVYPPQKRAVWKVGEQQEIRFRTSFQTYYIALWQQSLTQGAATLGPIVFQTTTGPSANSFYWVIQTYAFELQESNVFFFWLMEGNPPAQGNKSSSPGNMSSPYFNITLVDTTTKASTTAAPTAASSTSSSSTASISVSATPTPTPQPGDSAGEAGKVSSGDLSTGAKAGLAVGAVVILVLALVCLGLFLRYRSKKERELDALRRGQDPHESKRKPGAGVAHEIYSPSRSTRKMNRLHNGNAIELE